MYALAIPYGYKDQLPPDISDTYDQVVEVTCELPIVTQLVDVPKGRQLHILAPSSMDQQNANNFIESVNKSWIGLQITRNTYEFFKTKWWETVIVNFERLKRSTPLDQIKRIGDRKKAIVIANGPSMRKFLAKHKQPKDMTVFACWHALPKLIHYGWEPDYVVHCDPYITHGSELVHPSYKTSYICDPTAAPDFLKQCGERKLYTHYGVGKTPIEIVASLLNVKPHKAAGATVSSLMLLSAAYAGYEDVYLIGCDNSWGVDEPDYPEAEFVSTVTNKHGLERKTFPGFQEAASALWEVMRGFPDMKVHQLSKEVLDIKGVDYVDPVDLLGSD